MPHAFHGHSIARDIRRLPGRGLPHGQRVLDPLRLRLLVEVDRLGSITSAARACAMGQPTASAHLQTLEAAVGHRLYERSGRGTRLTDAGQLVARHGAGILSTLEVLEQELAALGNGRIGTLRLAACDGFGNYVLPDVLAAFTRARPHADIHVRVAPSWEVVRCVARGDAHLGIAGQTGRVRRIVTEPLLRDVLVGIAPPGLHDLNGTAAPAALGEQALLVSTPESSTRGFVEGMLQTVGWRPARTLELDSVEAVKRAVRSGLGVAFVSRLAIADELGRGELRTFGLRGAGSMERWLEIVRSEQRKPTPLEQVFARTLREHCIALERSHTSDRAMGAIGTSRFLAQPKPE